MVVDEARKLAAHVRRLAHCAVPVADDGLRDQCGEVVVVLPAHTFYRNGDVCCGDRVVADTDLRADELRLALLLSGDLSGVGRWRARLQAAKVLLGQLDEVLVGNATGADQHHAVCGVVGLDVVDKILTVDGENVLAGTEDCAA